MPKMVKFLLNLDVMATTNGVETVTVMIVDDDRDLLEMVNFILVSQNRNTRCVTCAADVFPELEAGSPVALILMDIFLGDGDGRDLTRKIKAHPVYKDIPVLLYSAGSNITAWSIKDYGADDFISKPFDLADITGRINKLLAGR